MQEHAYPYFYLAVTKDLTGFYALRYPKASFATSPYITNPMYNGPVCTAITLTGVLSLVEKKNPREAAKAKDTFVQGHPQFDDGNYGSLALAASLGLFFSTNDELPVFLVPDFKIFKLDIEGIMMVNECAPPVEISVEK